MGWVYVVGMVEEHILDLNEVRPIISSNLETAQTKVVQKVGTYAKEKKEKTNEE